MTVSIENLQYLLWYCYGLSSFFFDISKLQKNVANMLKKLLVRKFRRAFIYKKGARISWHILIISIIVC